MVKARELIDDEYRTAEQKRRTIGISKQSKIKYDEAAKLKLRALGYMQ